MNPSRFRTDLTGAQQLDAEDQLALYRQRFHMPTRSDGRPAIYFCGNSLGLQPRAAVEYVHAELEDWQQLAVQAHFEGRTPWYSYHEVFRETAPMSWGRQPGEVVMMNGLTTNLHLMMVSFYRPEGKRNKIVMEGSAFPSDTYAVKSQLRFHGVDPAKDCSYWSHVLESTRFAKRISKVC